MSKVVLFGGECDGYSQAAAFRERPDPVFYAVPLIDLEQVKDIKDPIAKATAFKGLGRLAYEFQSARTTNDNEVEFLYLRCRCDPSHDKESSVSTPPCNAD